MNQTQTEENQNRKDEVHDLLKTKKQTKQTKNHSN